MVGFGGEGARRSDWSVYLTFMSFSDLTFPKWRVYMYPLLVVFFLSLFVLSSFPGGNAGQSSTCNYLYI